ncbi:hypothetical protein CBM2589_A90778 [Cupriavidus taiwanensis]|uniref:Uncharacterized protein n=1 Tax=Cupriavidus taiwanensis TaxID=164546 RepID=A0A375CGC4_9BURK|nr:hypothetical protein CBM2589_A90778 [Cupriavidus taiwanensis]
MPKKRLKYRVSLYKIRNTKLNIILIEGNGGIPLLEHLRTQRPETPLARVCSPQCQPTGKNITTRRRRRGQKTRRNCGCRLFPPGRICHQRDYLWGC